MRSILGRCWRSGEEGDGVLVRELLRRIVDFDGMDWVSLVRINSFVDEIGSE